MPGTLPGAAISVEVSGLMLRQAAWAYKNPGLSLSHLYAVHHHMVLLAGGTVLCFHGPLTA